jgi:hypothetical protein
LSIPINLPGIQYGKIYIIILFHYMDSFTTWMLRGLYAKQEKSRLSQISDTIDWAPIRRVLEEMYDNKSERVGDQIATLF